MEPRRKWLALALGAVSALLIALSVPALVVPAQDSARMRAGVPGGRPARRGRLRERVRPLG